MRRPLDYKTVREHSRVRSGRLAAARQLGRHTHDQWVLLLAVCEHVCVRCFAEGISLEKDHIMPIAWGGSDGIENIQPLCASCNSSKGASYCRDFRPRIWREYLLGEVNDDGSTEKWERI